MQSLRHREHVITNFANERVGFNCLLRSERGPKKISSLLCTICSRKYCPKQLKARDLSLDVHPLKLSGFGFKNRITDGHNLDTCIAVPFFCPELFRNHSAMTLWWTCGTWCHLLYYDTFLLWGKKNLQKAVMRAW